MNTQATAKNAIEIATNYQGTNESAKICLQDAETCYARKDWEHATSRAKKSLAYSVGIFSTVYQAI